MRKKVTKEPMRWAYGVTTVEERMKSGLTARTLLSLDRAGFNDPLLQIDNGYGGAYGNWVLTLWKLWLRDPMAHRYAIFQDDFVTYRNLRDYLETVSLREKTYWNLYTSRSNHLMIGSEEGFVESNQYGRGAIALVFTHTGVRDLLSSKVIVERPVMTHTVQRWKGKNIDGAVITALKEKGYKELVHNPSLTFHTGTESTLDHGKYPDSESFRGENFDARELP